MRIGFVAALLVVMLPQLAHAFVSDELEVPAGADITAALNRPFPNVSEEQPIGAITIVREGLTGTVRVRAENCGQLMDVYGDGTWEVEAQDTAYYTDWLIARCKALAALDGQRGLAQPLPLDLDDDLLERLPAHFAPYRDCLVRTAQIRGALAGKSVDDMIDDDDWQAADIAPDAVNPLLQKFITEARDELSYEVLGAYLDQTTKRPVWLLLVSQIDGLTGASQMDLWPVIATEKARPGTAYDGALTYLSDTALIKAALDTCPAFLPALLDPDCPVIEDAPAPPAPSAE